MLQMRLTVKKAFSCMEVNALEYLCIIIQCNIVFIR